MALTNGEDIQLNEKQDPGDSKLKEDLFGGQALVKKYEKWLRYEVIGLCIVIVIVWGLLTLPVIFFYLPVSVDNEETQMDSGLGFPNASDSSIQNASMFNCRENFFPDPKFCVPICPDWRQDPKGVSILIDVVVGISYTSGFIIAASILVIAVIRRDSMFNFPNSLVVYISFIYFLQNFFYVVTFFDRGGLYCSSRNLFATFTDVTPFCVISALVGIYTTPSVAIWWLMLTAAIFWKVWFPIHARSFELRHKVKYVHLVCGIVGFLLPFIPLIAIMSKFSVDLKSQDPPKPSFWKGGLGFNQVRFPPVPCVTTDKNTLFYSVILPSDIILATGITLIILIFWLVHKQHGLLKANQSKNPYKIGNSERKLLLIFIYYIVSTVINLTAFADFAHKADVFEAELNKYFSCEALGHNPENPCEFDNVIITTLVVLSYAFHGILPIVNLIFAVNIQDLKKKCGPRMKRSVNTNSPKQTTTSTS